MQRQDAIVKCDKVTQQQDTRAPMKLEEEEELQQQDAMKANESGDATTGRNDAKTRR
jgi:hypothetical protein